MSVSPLSRYSLNGPRSFVVMRLTMREIIVMTPNPSSPVSSPVICSIVPIIVSMMPERSKPEAVTSTGYSAMVSSSNESI